jgi:amidase
MTVTTSDPPHNKGTTVIDVSAVQSVIKEQVKVNGHHVPSWQEISKMKQGDRDERLDPSSRIRNLDPSLLDLTTLRYTSDLLTPLQLEITSLSATVLASRIASRQYTSTQVLQSFIRTSTIAQDATNCLTEILYDEGLARAAELDDHLVRTGKTVGPLHGVPISVKDHIDLKGTDGASGFVGWCYKKIAVKDAVAIRCLREAGAVFYCKTSNPQSLLVCQ